MNSSAWEAHKRYVIKTAINFVLPHSEYHAHGGVKLGSIGLQKYQCHVTVIKVCNQMEECDINKGESFTHGVA